jgi:hypothetical protein
VCAADDDLENPVLVKMMKSIDTRFSKTTIGDNQSFRKFLTLNPDMRIKVNAL